MGTQLRPTERSTAAPTFRPMSIVAKGSPISATAKLLCIIVMSIGFVFFFIVVRLSRVW